MQLRALAASLLTSTFQLLAGLVVVAATTPPALLVLPPFACFYFELQRDYRSSATEAQRLQSLSRSPVLQQVKQYAQILRNFIFFFEFSQSSKFQSVSRFLSSLRA
jgi:hypothetical protein